MKRITFAIISLIAFSTISCFAEKIKGNGNIITKEIQVADYKQIKVGQGIETGGNSFFGKNQSPQVNYTQKGGKSELKFNSNGDVLQIETERGTRINPSKLIIETHSSELNKLGVSGGIDFFLRSSLSVENLEISASGASDVYLEKPIRITNLCKLNLSGASALKVSDLICDRIDTHSSGSSDMNLKGKANDGKYSCSGSSDIKAYNFVIKRLKCSASGSSDIFTTVTEKLEANASGSSDIKYKGNPEVKKHSSGSSDIDHIK